VATCVPRDEKCYIYFKGENRQTGLFLMRRGSGTLVSVLLISVLMSPLLVGNVFARAGSDDQTIQKIPELSWTAGTPFPVLDARTIFPTLASNSTNKPPEHATHWYAGSVYSGAQGTASIVYGSFQVPAFQPRSDEFYYVILSVWDSAGSYDQIGFANAYGVWGLAYSWTSGSPDNPTYHYTPEAMGLGPGEYTFYIMTGSGSTTFVVAQGSCDRRLVPLTCTGLRQVWILTAPTGGNYLLVQPFSFGYYGYTDYEEVWQTHGLLGCPNFNFFFHNNRWGSTIDSSGEAQWNVWETANVPGNVIVDASGSTVYVHNGIW
jgi:hypothetical protein